MKTNYQNFLITGVSSGFGRELALKAAEAGYTVIGTLRHAEQIEDYNQLVPGKTFGVLMDVTKYDQVDAALQTIAAEYGDIDVLVNNAGYGLTGLVEEVSMDELRAQMETNFFGLINLTKKVLPGMRKRQRGHIVQITSIGGIISYPQVGAYNASKYAVEGISEALAAEVAPFGVNVTIVEPSGFRTEWAGDSMHFAEAEITDYRGKLDRTRQKMRDINGKQPGNPELAARAMLLAIEADRPPLRLPLGAAAVENVYKKFDKVERDVEAWKEVAINTDDGGDTSLLRTPATALN